MMDIITDAVDDAAVFAMLASFAESAVDRTIKRGLLVRLRTSAGTVASHFQSLIDRNELCKLPFG